MRISWSLSVVVFIALGVWGYIHATRPGSPAPAPPESLLLASLLGAGAGFEAVDAERDHQFPADHGAHSRHRSEWWQFSGHLLGADGERFGFQLSFLRLGLKVDPQQRDSAWAAREIYRAHVSITDIAGDRFVSHEKLARAALGLSGARTRPVRVWVDDWSMEVAAGNDDETGFRLHARAAGLRLDLVLNATKPIVAPSRGLPLRGAPGQAPPFRYYAMTRLDTSGVLELDGKRHDVSGSSALDRAWGEVPLSQGPVVVDRFVLELDDGTELLCFQLRRRDGAGTPASTGLLVTGDGAVRALGDDDISIETIEQWRGPRGQSYASRWRLRMPQRKLDLDITAVVADQEVISAVRYWSGTVSFSGSVDGEAVHGLGHVQMSANG